MQVVVHVVKAHNNCGTSHPARRYNWIAYQDMSLPNALHSPHNAFMFRAGIVTSSFYNATSTIWFSVAFEKLRKAIISFIISVCLSACLSVHPYLSVCQSVCQSIRVCLSVILSVSVCLSVYVRLSISPSVSICLSVYVCLSVCLSVHPCLSVYLSVCTFA